MWLDPQIKQGTRFKSHSPSAPSSSRCAPSGTSVLAHTAPLAATAGRPMPGKVESPQAYSPGSGVVGPVFWGLGGGRFQGALGGGPRGAAGRVCWGPAPTLGWLTTFRVPTQAFAGCNIG
jgi:hypothetical protein